MDITMPVEWTGEYRGQTPASSFDGDQGRVDLAPNLKFEVQQEDGDVQTIPVRQSALDKCADFDASDLARGALVKFRSLVVLRNGEGQRSYLRHTAAALA